MKKGIEFTDLKFFDNSRQYKIPYENSIKNSVIVPQHYYTVAVDHKIKTELNSLVPRKLNDCTELDPEFDRWITETDGTAYRYFFFQTKDPGNFMIKLIG